MSSGSVVAVSRNAAYTFSKPVREEIILIAGLGVEGDVHAGVTVRHRSRVRSDPTQPNVRQVHLIPAELFDELRDAGYDVSPGQLGENVTTRGIDVLGLPRGTILRFGPGADRGTAARAPGGLEPPVAGVTSVGPAGGEVGASAAGQVAEPAGGEAAGGQVAELAGNDVAVSAGSKVAGFAGSGASGARAAGPDTAALAGLFAAARRPTISEATAAAVAAVEAAAVRAVRGDDHPGGADVRPAIVITGLRNPCVQINGFRAGLLKRVVGQDEDGNVVARAGVMGVVLRGGPVRPGDPVTVDLPPEPHSPLQRV